MFYVLYFLKTCAISYYLRGINSSISLTRHWKGQQMALNVLDVWTPCLLWALKGISNVQQVYYIYTCHEFLWQLLFIIDTVKGISIELLIDLHERKSHGIFSFLFFSFQVPWSTFRFPNLNLAFGKVLIRWW